MQACQHAETRPGPAQGYQHSVACHPYTQECPQASGGITFTETCRTCGARRAVNQNQEWFEFGPWGPARVARQATATRARQQATQTPCPAPLRLTRGSDTITVHGDPDGIVWVQWPDNRAISAADEQAVLTALPPAWLAQATARRTRILAAAQAEADVD